ncbi:MAG: hypothetical protein PWR16_1700 [Methanoculleus sp.]|nr:hypothetical protein [Methanoculleus sp.]
MMRNGVDMERVNALMKAMRKDAAAGRRTLSGITSWNGGAHSTTIVRNFAVPADEPVLLGGTGRGASPTELVPTVFPPASRSVSPTARPRMRARSMRSRSTSRATSILRGSSRCDGPKVRSTRKREAFSSGDCPKVRSTRKRFAFSSGDCPKVRVSRRSA